MRGVIEALEGQTLVVATPNDGVVRLTLTDMTGINGLEKRSMADITDNTFIGATAVKDRNGRWQATEVHIFPEAMRGAGEGHYAWDLPESTMTNGAATGVAAKGRSGTLTVRYAGGDGRSRRHAADGDRRAHDGQPRAARAGRDGTWRSRRPRRRRPAMAVAVIAETNGVKPPM